MEVKDAIQQIKTVLAEVEVKGQAFVHIPALKQFLDAVEKSATISIETNKLQHQSNLEWYKAQRQAQLEMFKSTMEAAHSALKTSLIVNGGAAVALLAFIGNVWAKTQTAEVAIALATSVGWFSGGVLGGAGSRHSQRTSRSSSIHAYTKIPALHFTLLLLVSLLFRISPSDWVWSQRMVLSSLILSPNRR